MTLSQFSVLQMLCINHRVIDHWFGNLMKKIFRLASLLNSILLVLQISLAPSFPQKNPFHLCFRSFARCPVCRSVRLWYSGFSDDDKHCSNWSVLVKSLWSESSVSVCFDEPCDSWKRWPGHNLSEEVSAIISGNSLFTKWLIYSRFCSFSVFCPFE